MESLDLDKKGKDQFHKLRGMCKLLMFLDRSVSQDPVMVKRWLYLDPHSFLMANVRVGLNFLLTRGVDFLNDCPTIYWFWENWLNFWPFLKSSADLSWNINKSHMNYNLWNWPPPLLSGSNDSIDKLVFDKIWHCAHKTFWLIELKKLFYKPKYVA